MTLAVPSHLATAGLIVAGIGELVSSRDREQTLVSYGLGSCVGLTAWDPQTRASALAHFMLPTGTGGSAPVKFIDEGFDRFLAVFRSVGGSPSRAQFKAVGGAAMLAVISNSLDVGRRNVAALHERLAAAGLRLVASELGGSAGRTVQLAVGDGRLLVKSVTGIKTL